MLFSSVTPSTEPTKSPEPPTSENPSSAPPSTPSAAPLQTPQPGSLLHLQAAPFRYGFKPTKGGRPNVGDYIDEVRDLLLLAIARYSVSLFTVNAFPGIAQQHEFVCRAWNEISAAQDKPVPWELSDRMITAVRCLLWLRTHSLIHCVVIQIGRRKSNARGDISDRIRPLIPEAYKFRSTVNYTNEKHNITLSNQLAEDGMFHHKVCPIYIPTCRAK